MRVLETKIMSETTQLKFAFATPTWEQQQLALVERISKHTSPVQVHLDHNRARRELIRLAVKKLVAARIAMRDAAFLRDVGIKSEEA